MQVTMYNTSSGETELVQGVERYHFNEDWGDNGRWEFMNFEGEAWTMGWDWKVVSGESESVIR